MPVLHSQNRWSDRLLVEVVRMREETAGHPLHAPAADAAGRAAGGPLVRRIRARARQLPGAEALRAGLVRQVRIGLWLTAALAALMALAGATAATAALGASDPVSLPLALLVLVGLNSLSLVFWLVFLPFSGRAGAGLSGLLQKLWRRFGAPRPAQRSNKPSANPAATRDSDILRLLLAGPAGRWLMGAGVHLAWLAFTTAALLLLALLMSVRAYDLSWQTTLLSPAGLHAWAEAISWGPALIGIPGPGALPVTGTMAAPAREGWALWLLAAVFLYGLVPRALALILCAASAWRALSRLGTDMSLPGFARLQARLLPDHGDTWVVDPATPSPAASNAALAKHTPLPEGPLHGLGLEYAPAAEPSGKNWTWLGTVDDGASRVQMLDRLQDKQINALAVLVRAEATPDRGNERMLATLAQATDAPMVLVLCSEDKTCEHTESWVALAERVPVSHGVVAWDTHSDLAGQLVEAGA